MSSENACRQKTVPTAGDYNADQHSQRHQFHDKTSSDIFCRHLPTEGTESSGNATVDREELIFPSAGHDTRHADQKQLEREHFRSPSEVQPENANQGKQVELSSGSASVDREELLFPSAGHFTRYADGRHGERRHFQE